MNIYNEFKKLALKFSIKAITIQLPTKELRKKEVLMPKQIIVEVDENGKINFETDGFIGEECIQNDVVNHVKNSLGKGLGPEFKAVFYQKNQTKTVHKNFCG